MDRCSTCGVEAELIPHHVSYEPEVVERICRSCHGKAHASEDAPKRPEGFRYYDISSEKAELKLRPSTREALKLLGRKGDSYDDVVRRLLKYWIAEMIPEAAAPIQELLGEEEAPG